ncbi:MAG TPA: 2'-5' RNA ligase family protein [Dokdonella sp.]|nr:2'-5' RNA ligase family protein [Dokdonella sp.]
MAHTYFFALFPDPATRDRIHMAAAALQARLRLRGRLVAPARLHVTLHFLGRFGSAQAALEAQAREAGCAVRNPALRVVFDRALSFVHGREKSPCVFAMEDGTGPVHGLASGLAEALGSPSWLAGTSRPFRPHVTWLYSEDCIEGELPIDPLAWPAGEFALVHGIQGASDYRILQRWPLG